MINMKLFAAEVCGMNKQGKTQIMVRQKCDCGSFHEIPEIEVGTSQYWKCGKCLDKQSQEFSQWFSSVIKNGICS